jgi:hypothetical protein
MNNSTTSISFSIFSNKGIYALFLGAGVSKSSGIPTGWDIVLDLIEKLAKLKKEKCLPDPVEWYKEKYGEEPEYSNILAKLVKSSSERVNFLKPYFEPTDEEFEQGLKLPTPAHKEIARLAKCGYIKVIITTNFDRLLEKAFDEIGVEPVVIRHPDDIDGAMPLVHSDFTLIKINGDYLDSRFLNTQEELSEYNSKLHEYLLRIVSEFGILSCGWSGKWDKGFVNILRQCENYRYYSYWTYVGTCEKELQEIAKFRKGETVGIVSADTFFKEISDNIESLETISDNHPLTSDIAVARLKKYIVKEENKILLHDLIFNQQEEVFSKITEKTDLSLYPDSKNLLPYLSFVEKCIEPLLPLIINGVLWAKPEHNYLFSTMLSRLSEPPKSSNTKAYEVTKQFYYFPALLTLYTIGLSAIKCKNYKLLLNCFQLKINENDSDYSDQFMIIERINSFLVDPKAMNAILAHGKNYHTPISTYICKYLHPYFTNHIMSEKEYNDTFDVFEYILALNFLHIIGDKFGINWAPVGQFQWRKGTLRTRSYMLNDMLMEADKMKSNWELLNSGMFDGKYENYEAARSKLDSFLQNVHFY